MILLNNPNAFRDMPIEFVYAVGALLIVFVITLPIKIWMRRRGK